MGDKKKNNKRKDKQQSAIKEVKKKAEKKMESKKKLMKKSAKRDTKQKKDRTAWDKIRKKMPDDYVIPDPAFIEALRVRDTKSGAPSICFAILAHQNEEVLANQIENVRRYNQGAKIILYNGGHDKHFGESLDIQICPYSRPLHEKFKLGRFMYDVMRWLEKSKESYEYVINLDSDYMFVNHGFGQWLEKVMYGHDFMGVHATRYCTPEETKDWIPGDTMWKEWHLWQPFFQTDCFYGTLNGVQVFRRGIVKKILASIDKDHLEALLAGTKVYALEEILLPTLAMRCGAKMRAYPESTIEFIRLGDVYTIEEVRRAKRNPDIYFVHPIEREMTDPARKWLTSGDAATKNEMQQNGNTWWGTPKLLNSRQLMSNIIDALENKQPFAVVNVGATESFVMAQYTVLSEEVFMSHSEARVANRGERSGFYHRGIRFPNIQARDDVVEAVKKADIIGYNTVVHNMDGGLLTEKAFEYNQFSPKYVFEGYLRRVIMFSQKEKFEEMLKGRKILLISSIAEQARDALNERLRDKLGFEIVGAIPIFEYEEILEVKRQIDNLEFDLCLLAAGVSAIILAAYIKEVHGKVAFDIGFGMQSLITNQVYEDFWLNNYIGLDKIMQM